MTNGARFVCTLEPQEAPRRTEQVHRLASQLVEHARWDDRRTRLTFPREAGSLVEEFVRDESACCAFFAFDVERAGDATHLHVAAPEGAEEMLDALLDALGG